MKFSGVKILQGVEISIFLLIFEWALQQCSATALPVIIAIIVIVYLIKTQLRFFSLFLICYHCMVNKDYQCNEFFLDICHRLLYFKPDCTYSVDLLRLCFHLHLHCTCHCSPLSFPPSCLYYYLCSFVCLGGQFNERMLLWQPFER